MIVDFHCHTNCSDGELTPTELIRLAEQECVEVLAITDHDTIDAYKDLPKTYIKLITGIEFSTSWNKIGIHIVGLNFDTNSKALLQAVEKQQIARKLRAQAISLKLEKIGLKGSYLQLKHKKQIGRPDFAQLLVEEGICKDHSQAFKKYLGAGKLGDVKNQWLSLEEVITVINHAGGIPVLAHPLYYKLTNAKLKRLLTDFKLHGGKAMEVVNGYQNPEKTQYLQKLCTEFSMFASIGSDFHRRMNWRHLGCEIDKKLYPIITQF